MLISVCCKKFPNFSSVCIEHALVNADSKLCVLMEASFLSSFQRILCLPSLPPPYTLAAGRISFLVWSQYLGQCLGHSGLLISICELVEFQFLTIISQILVCIMKFVLHLMFFSSIVFLHSVLLRLLLCDSLQTYVLSLHRVYRVL